MAMLAIFRAHDGEAITIHRTYLTKYSQKLNIESPKKILPALKPMVGGAVRLFGYSDTLGIAEGIETAIAVTESMGVPCWAALSSALLESWEPPKDVHRVIVFGDNDVNFTGQKASYTLANRLIVKNNIVSDVDIPEIPGEDFLDKKIS